MNTHYVPSTHSMPNSMQMMGEGITEQNYPTSLDPSYSRELYQIPDNLGPCGIPTDHSLRPTHLPVNYDCGYLSDMSYQSRLVSIYCFYFVYGHYRLMTALGCLQCMSSRVFPLYSTCETVPDCKTATRSQSSARDSLAASTSTNLTSRLTTQVKYLNLEFYRK